SVRENYQEHPYTTLNNGGTCIHTALKFNSPTTNSSQFQHAKFSYKSHHSPFFKHVYASEICTPIHRPLPFSEPVQIQSRHNLYIKKKNPPLQISTKSSLYHTIPTTHTSKHQSPQKSKPLS
ncbi:hypothetical protein KC19_N046300, partial [Ceratodon purpureus]